jgi:DNA-binding transcriptional regulator YiaG
MKAKIKDSVALQNWSKFKAGRLKLRTWRVNPGTQTRIMSYKGIEEIRKQKAMALKSIRAKELKMSQSQLAKVIHVSPRTLQGWEIGKSSAPEPVVLLLELMRDIPAVRKRLAAA